jgi:hypothetical protein
MDSYKPSGWARRDLFYGTAAASLAVLAPARDMWPTCWPPQAKPAVLALRAAVQRKRPRFAKRGADAFIRCSSIKT